MHTYWLSFAAHKLICSGKVSASTMLREPGPTAPCIRSASSTNKPRWVLYISKRPAAYAQPLTCKIQETYTRKRAAYVYIATWKIWNAYTTFYHIAITNGIAIALHLHYITLRDMARHCIAWHYIAWCYVTWHHVHTLHTHIHAYFTITLQLHYSTFHCIRLRTKPYYPKPCSTYATYTTQTSISTNFTYSTLHQHIRTQVCVTLHFQIHSIACIRGIHCIHSINDVHILYIGYRLTIPPIGDYEKAFSVAQS